MKNKLNLAIIGIFVVLSLISAVSAFGVASPGAAVNMYPGETKIVNLNVQNIAGAAEDVLAVMSIIGDPESFAKMEKGEYLVKAGEAVDVPVTITIPKNSTLTSYAVVVETKSTSPSTPGGVSFGMGMQSLIPITIVAPPKEISEQKGYMTYVYIALIALVLVLVAIAIIVLKKRRKKK